MANEKTVNKRRRKLAKHLYSGILARLNERTGNNQDAQRIASQVACDAADALIHEFDERGWQ